MRAKLLVNGLIVVCISLILISILVIAEKPKTDLKTENIAIKSVSSQILADGQITSQNEAKLQFQTGGRLTYLPFKEGDHVSAGQTIASLDTYALQRQLSIALNNYQSTRDAFDQTQQNANNGVYKTSTNTVTELNQLGTGPSQPTDAVDNMIKRIVDQSQAGLNNSVTQVELANYALQLASLNSPIDGIITHEDVTVANVNVTPATTFVVDDPNTIVIRAQVSEDDIDFVSEGSIATISLNGNTSRTFAGTVVTIHPQKVTLPSGQNVYMVDIESDDLKNTAQFGQSASVQIQSNTSGSTKLVPTWTVLNHQYIWVDENGTKALKQIKTGKTHGTYTEIVSGLSDTDSVVISPKAIIGSAYTIL